jgi:hypothetical protein
VVGDLQDRQWSRVGAVRHVLLLVRLGVASEQDACRAIAQEDGNRVVVDLRKETAFEVCRRADNVLERAAREERPQPT